MIRVLVFSKDRALQLDACLASLFRHIEDASDVRLTVLCKGSSARLTRQYEELARMYDQRAQFLVEGVFRQQVLGAFEQVHGSAVSPSPVGRLVRRSQGETERSSEANSVPDCMLFLVDDTVFVRRMRLESAQEALQANPDALGFSLRLGRNITRNYVLDGEQALPKFRQERHGILKYDWTLAAGDFAYPLEISSSVYRLADMIPTLGTLAFENPNTLESRLSERAKRFARKQPFMLCPELSVAFSIPANRVQEVFENRSGSDPRWSIEQLATHFDSGQRIDVSRLDGFTPTACHQEVELSFDTRI
jgi:hypothetical protein